MSSKRLADKLSRDNESEDDMSSELSVADEVERREDDLEEKKDASWL